MPFPAVSALLFERIAHCVFNPIVNVGAVGIKKMHNAHIALVELTTEGREKTQQDWKGTLGEIS